MTKKKEKSYYFGFYKVKKELLQKAFIIYQMKIMIQNKISKYMLLNLWRFYHKIKGKLKREINIMIF